MYMYIIYRYIILQINIPRLPSPYTNPVSPAAPGTIRREQWPGASLRKRCKVGAGALQSLLDFSWAAVDLQRSWQIMCYIQKNFIEIRYKYITHVLYLFMCYIQIYFSKEIWKLNLQQHGQMEKHGQEEALRISGFTLFFFSIPNTKPLV